MASRPVQTALGEVFWWDEEIWVLAGRIESSSSGGNFPHSALPRCVPPFLISIVLLAPGTQILFLDLPWSRARHVEYGTWSRHDRCV